MTKSTTGLGIRVCIISRCFSCVTVLLEMRHLNSVLLSHIITVESDMCLGIRTKTSASKSQVPGSIQDKPPDKPPV